MASSICFINLNRIKIQIIRKQLQKSLRKLQKLMKFFQNLRRNLIMTNMVINNHLQLLIINNLPIMGINFNKTLMIFQIFHLDSIIISIRSIIILNINILNNLLVFHNSIECLIWINSFLEIILILLRYSRIFLKTIHFLIKIFMVITNSNKKRVWWKPIHLKMILMMIFLNQSIKMVQIKVATL